MKKLMILVLLLGLLIVPGIGVNFAQDDCDDEIGCVVLAEDDPVVVGYLLALSGPVSFLGEDTKGSIEIVYEERGGELLGRELELVEADGTCSAEGGQSAAQQLTSDDLLIGIIGTTCSGESTGAIPIISDAGLTMISASATSPFLTDDDVDNGGIYEPGFFRTAQNDLFQGRLAAEFAYNELGLRRLATLHDGDAYTDGLQGAMANAFAELGGEIVFQGAINKGDEDMTAVLTEVASAEPDVFYFPIFQPEADFIVAQSGGIDGMEDITLFAADGLFVDAFPQAAGENIAGMYLSSPYVTGEEYDALLQSWADVVGGTPPSAFHAHAYDATNILLNAIEAVAVEMDDGSVSIGRQALRDEVASLTDYDGLTGTLSCGPTGDCATGEALAVYQIADEDSWPPELVFIPTGGGDDMDMDEDMDMDMDEDDSEEDSDD
ncbi:MAG: branched-chain amino acid ABC transporter substrate-binding protein [Aggregatilineales bacterium]